MVISVNEILFISYKSPIWNYFIDIVTLF